VGAFLFIGFLFSVPIYVRAFTALSPLEVDPGGARFAGRYRRWEVRSLTGRVGGTNTYTTTTTRVTYQASQYHDGYDKHVSASTSVHDTLLLVDAAGQQHSLTLTDFGLEVFDGQIVSVCWGVRGSKQVVVAVLNHSTRRHFTRRANLDKVLIPRVPLFTLWTLAAIIFSVIGSIVLGFVIGLLPVVIFAATNRRQRRRFVNSGIGGLWTSTAAAAAAL
jgi:hypothetical protein